jgi:hypothetical protein
MKQPSFVKLKTDIKRPLLDSIVSAFLKSGIDTRAKAQKSSGASLSSVGKVAAALVDSGFMSERLYSVKSGTRPQNHLTLNDNCRIMVLDLSHADFTAHIISGTNKCIFADRHLYDYDISFEENLYVFLSRSGLKIKQRGLSVNAVCIIYADKDYAYADSTRFSSFRLPTVDEIFKVDRVISSIFKVKALVHMSVSDSVAQAIKFGLISAVDAPYGVSYIFAGNHLATFHVTGEGQATICNVSELMLDDSSTALSILSGAANSQMFCDVAFRIANIMCCVFRSQTIIIESDKFECNASAMHEISRRFAISGIMPPRILNISQDMPLRTLGAARATLLIYIGRYIKAVDE